MSRRLVYFPFTLLLIGGILLMSLQDGKDMEAS